jgi:AraC-like DNA-binding protein
MNWLKHGNVTKLAEAMNMTAQQFTKRFNCVFGETPYRWMQQEKARLIYGEICQNSKPLKEIAWDYGFTAYTHFSRFCRTSFNMNPVEIRK